VGLNLVAMYRALGGGWEIRAGKDFVPDDIKAEMLQRTNWGGLLEPEEAQKVPAKDPPPLFNRPDW
jgi:hypothetical protein